MLGSVTAGAFGVRSSTDSAFPSTVYLAYTGLDRLRISSAGEVAIGADSFGYRLNVGGAVNASSFYAGGAQLLTSLIASPITTGQAAADKALTVNAKRDVV